MYAWSKFKKDVNEWGVVQEWIMPGDEISQGDLDVSDEEWQDLIDSGAVREEPYPDIAPDLAPAEHFKLNPEEAPTIDVDVTTPSEEAMPKTELAGDIGKLPTEGEPGKQEETEQKQPWQK